MKLLLFSDVHINRNRCDEIIRKSKEVDLLIGAGDYGSVRRGVDKTIGWLNVIDKPAILVPGNSESDQELKEACKAWKSATVLHGTSAEKFGYNFYGIGGGIPVTPFGSWSYDFTEEEGRELLKDFKENSILITHSPPFGVLDLNGSNQHCGSSAVKEVIENKSPLLVVCGHVHESNGKKERYKNVDVVNCGPSGMIYELPDLV